MTDTHLSPAQVQERPVAEPLPGAAARPSAWGGGRIAAVVIGALLVLVSFVLLGAGGTGAWADLTQRDAGYVTTGVHDFSTAGSALATESTHLGSPGVGWLYSPGLLGKVRIRVTPVSAGPALFVGIGRSDDVDRYLAGVDHTVISDFFGNKAKEIGGGAPGSTPGTQHFWVATSTGSGERTLKWAPHGGSWTVVVMNAKGTPGIGVRADLGARMPAVVWIAIGLLIAGAVFLAGGGMLIAGAIRGRRAISMAPHATTDVSEGRSDPSIDEAASTFLAKKRVAVTGVSRTPKTHGSNNVYRRLRERGYDVFAVNPNAGEVEGEVSYPDLKSIPGGVEAVVIGTRPERADETMRECAELGIEHVWMHRGPGAGSVSATATAYGRQHGITVIDGGCPCMFDPTADFGHKVMRRLYARHVPKQV